MADLYHNYNLSTGQVCAVLQYSEPSHNRYKSLQKNVKLQWAPTICLVWQQKYLKHMIIMREILLHQLFPHRSWARQIAEFSSCFFEFSKNIFINIIMLKKTRNYSQSVRIFCGDLLVLVFVIRSERAAYIANCYNRSRSNLWSIIARKLRKRAQRYL